MQPRNQGSEFVGTRLRKLAGTVALRDTAKILAGLQSKSAEDELDSSPDSRTATGLAGLGRQTTRSPGARCGEYPSSPSPCA